MPTANSVSQLGAVVILLVSLTACSGGSGGEEPIAVLEPMIIVEPQDLLMAIGSNIEFKASSNGEDLTSTVDWRSSDEQIISFDARSGLRNFASANAVGTVSVTAIQEGYRPGNATVEVTLLAKDGEYRAQYVNESSARIELMFTVAMGTMTNFEIRRALIPCSPVFFVSTPDLVRDSPIPILNDRADFIETSAVLTFSNDLDADVRGVAQIDSTVEFTEIGVAVGTISLLFIDQSGIHCTIRREFVWDATLVD